MKKKPKFGLQLSKYDLNLLLKSQKIEDIITGIDRFIKYNRFVLHLNGIKVLKFLKSSNAMIRKAVISNLRYFYSPVFTKYLTRILLKTANPDVAFGILSNIKWYIDPYWALILRKIYFHTAKKLKLAGMDEDTIKKIRLLIIKNCKSIY